MNLKAKIKEDFGGKERKVSIHKFFIQKEVLVAVFSYDDDGLIGIKRACDLRIVGGQ